MQVQLVPFYFKFICIGDSAQSSRRIGLMRGGGNGGGSWGKEEERRGELCVKRRDRHSGMV